MSINVFKGTDKNMCCRGIRSNLAGGDYSVIIGRNGSTAKAGKNSVIVLTEWEWIDDAWTPVHVKAEIVDGEKIKADTWYKLENGEFVEVEYEPDHL